jgi:hypothetical protein
MPPKTAKVKDDELFNWFDTKGVKKLLPKEEPYPFEDTQIKINSRILCVGSTNTGKTQSLIHYINKIPETFSKIFVYYKESEHLYDFLRERLKGKIEFHTSLADLPTLANMRKDAEDTDRYLVVLDDYMMELKNYKNVADYFIYGRKKNITLFCLAQNHYTIPKVLRSQMTCLLLFAMTQQKDKNLILSEFDTEDKQLRNIYDDATKVKLSFLKIQTGQCPPNKRFSKGFTKFFTIENEH